MRWEREVSPRPQEQGAGLPGIQPMRHLIRRDRSAREAGKYRMGSTRRTGRQARIRTWGWTVRSYGTGLDDTFATKKQDEKMKRHPKGNQGRYAAYGVETEETLAQTEITKTRDNHRVDPQNDDRT
ncbi:hypothetical protein G6F39_014155 [Rhizopus arrhizus]|nr:hypothetical protein G6F39_014155 [Rhizopus arrhizus]